jgi:hypothetical protein
MIDNNINNEESIFIVQNPPPPKKISTLSLPTRELPIWGDTDKVEVRKKGGIGVHNLSHTKKISVAFHDFLSPHYLVYTATV